MAIGEQTLSRSEVLQRAQALLPGLKARAVETEGLRQIAPATIEELKTSGLMRVAIFSDIHGNLQALESLLADIAAQKPDAVYCLGDLVGYGANPNEVTGRIRRENIPTIMGNYDDGVGFDRDECGCAYVKETDKREGDAGFAWTKAHTSDANKAWLRTLDPQVRFEADGRRYLLVHGSPRRINEYVYEDKPDATFARIAAGADADDIHGY